MMRMTAAAAARLAVTAEVLGIDSDGTSPTIAFSVWRHGLYSADRTLLKRYLFNCGEGTQRLCGENGIKLSSLDAIYLTRVDVQTASGIPGLVFALGGVGAAHLTVSGPRGIHKRLLSMQTFVRRKYPAVECWEIEGTPTEANIALDADDSIPRRDWVAWSARDDAYASVIAVPLDSASPLSCHPEGCPVCRQDCSARVPINTNESADATNLIPPASDRSPQQPDPARLWMVRFYESKGLHDKLPHVDQILRRYRGDLGRLQADLIVKYGEMVTEEATATCCASASSEDESEEEASAPDHSDSPVTRQWLTKFYKQFEPAKVHRVDQILRQFAGREEQLKTMLLAKYGNEVRRETALVRELPPLKKPRVHPENNDHILVTPEDIPVSLVNIANRPEPSVPGSHSSSGGTSCYIIRFGTASFPIAWIIDCQEESHVEALEEAFPIPSCHRAPELIVHLTPASMFFTSRYQSWVKMVVEKWPSSQHLVFDGRTLQAHSDGIYSFAYLSSARHASERSGPELSSRWKALSTCLSDKTRSTPMRRKFQVKLATTNTSVHIAQAQLRFHLSHPGASPAPPMFDYSETGWKARSDEDQESVDDEAQLQAPSSHTSSPPLPRTDDHDRKLVILGTGSAAPSKLRASSGIYLELTPHSASTVEAVPGLLIDCGEGTYGQLWRQFDAPGQLEARLTGIRCIWISHHHADHQCGLLRVLAAYVQQTESLSTREELFVIAPQSVLAYVSAWFPQLPMHVRLVTCTTMNSTDSPIRGEFLRQMHPFLLDLQSVKVWHCHDAYGLILCLANGEKIVYSGDTRPVDQLVRAGMDAALLIHEATFDDSMADDAERKRHSTVSEAISIGRRMRARQIILTHFSQRYPKLPPPTTADDDVKLESHVYFAHDGFSMTL